MKWNTLFEGVNGDLFLLLRFYRFAENEKQTFDFYIVNCYIMIVMFILSYVYMVLQNRRRRSI